MTTPVALASTQYTARLVGQRLRELRLQNNWSQRELAERSGVAFSTYRKLEASGNGNIVALVKVLRALGALDRLEAMVSEPVVGPYDAGFQRQRAAKRVSAALGSGGRA